MEWIDCGGNTPEMPQISWLYTYSRQHLLLWSLVTFLTIFFFPLPLTCLNLVSFYFFQKPLINPMGEQLRQMHKSSGLILCSFSLTNLMQFAFDLKDPQPMIQFQISPLPYHQKNLWSLHLVGSSGCSIISSSSIHQPKRKPNWWMMSIWGGSDNHAFHDLKMIFAITPACFLLIILQP